MVHMSTLIAIALALASAHVQTPSADDVVKQFIPYEALGAEPADDLVGSCAAVLEVDAAGQPRAIAAGYVGPHRGRLLILERGSDGRFTAVGEEGVHGDGKGCELEVVRFAAADPLTILMTVAIGMRGNHWEGSTFRWEPAEAAGRRLVFMETGLHDPELMDIRHDGTREMVTSVFDYDEPFDGIRTYTVEQTGVIEAWWPCYGDCEADVARLTQADGAGTYSLRLVNGTQGGADRVRVSSVTVNGRQKLPARSRGIDAEFIDVPLGRGLRAGTVVRIRATPTGSNGRLIAALIRRP
jgi:hypothetical protein